MNPLLLTLVALATAFLCQIFALWLCIDGYFRQPARRPILACAGMAMLLLALQQAYAMELLLSTGLYDLRQGLLAGFIALALLPGIFHLARRSS